jgi:adenylate cyclase
MERRLAAILMVDVVGYTTLMGKDETGTLNLIKTLWSEHFEPRVIEHNGRIVKLMGDGALVEFQSIVDALNCAITVQHDARERNEGIAVDEQIEMRIGINLGDVIIEAEDVFGEGVNVAARLEKLSPPGGIALSATAYEHAKVSSTTHFEDIGEKKLKNIDKPVHVYLWSEDSSANELQPPAKPSIAVLAFDNMSGDPQQEYFADGLAEDIITELSRFQTFFVIARNSSFSYKGRHVPVQLIARELGVLYVLEGSVRKIGDRVRITVQLIETMTGHHLWAERYDHELTDVFEVQDEATRCIVAAIPGHLELADLRRVKLKRSENMLAYDYMLRGRLHHHRGTREDNKEALRLLNKAINLDPEFAEAYAWQSCTLGQAQVRGYGDNDEELFHREISDAEIGLSLDENNVTCQWNMCELYLEWANRAYGKRHPIATLKARLVLAEAHHNKAFTLNHNDPRVVAQRGELFTWQGKADEGAVWVRLAMRLDPHAAASRAHLLVRALHVARHYEEAIVEFAQIINHRYSHHAEISACYAQLGEAEMAKKHVSAVMHLKPDFSTAHYLNSLPLEKTQDKNHHNDGLRKAGLPE